MDTISSTRPAVALLCRRQQRVCFAPPVREAADFSDFEITSVDSIGRLAAAVTA